MLCYEVYDTAILKQILFLPSKSHNVDTLFRNRYYNIYVCRIGVYEPIPN